MPAAIQGVVIAVAEELRRQVAVVVEGIGLDEARRVGRVPSAGQMLPLPGGAGDHLEVVRHVLGERHLDGVHDHAAPRVVRLLGDNAAVGIDQAETDERLARPVGIDAVDVDLAEVVFVVAMRGGHAEADLPRELPVVADRELVDVRLMQVLVEQQTGIDAVARRGRDDRGPGAVLGRVDFGLVERARRLAEGHDVVAAVDLLVETAVAGADDVPRVLGDEKRGADARLHRDAFLSIDVEQGVVAFDEVDAQTAVDGQARRGRPRVLRVESDVAVVFADGRAHRGRAVALVERREAKQVVGRVDPAVAAQAEAAIDLLGDGLAHQRRRRPDAGLELVAATPALLVVGEVAADQPDVRV